MVPQSFHVAGREERGVKMIKLGMSADLLVALRRASRYLKDHESWIKYKKKAGSDGGRINGSNSHTHLLRSLCNINYE